MQQAKERMLLELLELERAEPGPLALPAGTCLLCGDNCSRREGKPCRSPERMRYSIEALG